MKRMKESGRAFRKKRKAKEEEARKNKGALLKCIKRTSTAEVAETKGETEDKVDIANVDTRTAEGDIDSVDAAKTVSDGDAPEVEELERQSLVGSAAVQIMNSRK